MWLENLADVLRTTDFPVVEIHGWQRRGRSNNSQYQQKPRHIMIHHTAVKGSTSREQQYSRALAGATTHSVAPVSNLHLGAFDGTWYVQAAGPTNTNGKGVDPCGLLVPDTMNLDAIGIEAENNGVGEPWSEIMQESYLQGCAALQKEYGILNKRIHSHCEYASTRKIDTAGPSRWANMQDKYMRWDMNAFRHSVQHRIDVLNHPVGVLMNKAVLLKTPESGHLFAWNGVNLSFLSDPDMLSLGTERGLYDSNIVVISKERLQELMNWQMVTPRPYPF